MNNETPCLADAVSEWQQQHNITFDEMFKQSATLTMCLAAQLFDEQTGEPNSEGTVEMFLPPDPDGDPRESRLLELTVVSTIYDKERLN